MPEPFKPKLKTVSSEITKTLRNRGVQLSVCGGKRAALPALNSATGFWEDPGLTNKAPRWIVHLSKRDGVWEAALPDQEGSRRIGSFNTANRPVACIGVLPLVAIKRVQASHAFLTDWSWLLWFLFPNALRNGSSAQLVEDYDPAAGGLRYMGQDVGYVQAGLVTLCDPTWVDPRVLDLTYSQATQALARFLHVDLLRTPDA